MKLNPREAGQKVRDRAVSREGKVVTKACVLCVEACHYLVTS